MRRFILSLLLLHSCKVLSLTCTQSDWVKSLCELDIYPGTRCQDAKYFRTYCNAQTLGCQKVGGCFGFTPPGHWYPIIESGIPRWRCRCGCFAEETLLSGFTDWPAKNLLNKNKPELISSLDSIDSLSFSLRRFNGLVYGKQKSLLEIETENKLKILVSRGHPMVLADKRGYLKAITKASSLKLGDMLLSSDFSKQKITSIKKKEDYLGQVINFNILSSDPSHHLIVAAKLLVGDIAWQESLNAVNSRLLWRNDLVNFLTNKKGEDYEL